MHQQYIEKRSGPEDDNAPDQPAKYGRINFTIWFADMKNAGDGCLNKDGIPITELLTEPELKKSTHKHLIADIIDEIEESMLKKRSG
jgi:hypothetical protein